MSHAPGALLVRQGGGDLRILASGRPSDVRTHPQAATARVVNLPSAVILPALVNAHTHLDLTHIGPIPHDPSRGFAQWASVVVRNRRHDAAGIRASVREGVRRSLLGGVVAVGDIAGEWSTAPLEELRDSPLIGASLIECFGMGSRQASSIERLRAVMQSVETDAAGVRAGVSPHAPYSAGNGLVRAALDLCTTQHAPFQMHLAESLDEREFLLQSRGPVRALLESLGLWNDSLAADLGRAESSAAHVLAPLGDAIRDAAGRAPVAFVHVNDLNDHSLDLLVRCGASVIYCPRSSAYFGADRAFGPHRYADLVAAGVPVALGTDSVMNLPAPPGGGPPPISTLDEVRFLWRRDGDSGGRVPLRRLLAMATTDAARAIGLDPAQFDITPGPSAGLIAVPVGGTSTAADPLLRAVLSPAPPRLLIHAKDSGLTAVLPPAAF